jgi:hypothetical protein
MAAAVPGAVVLVLGQAAAVTSPRAAGKAMLAALVMNVALNAAVVPRWGADGAAAVTLVCHLTLAAALAGRVVGRPSADAGEVRVPVPREPAVAQPG